MFSKPGFGDFPHNWVWEQYKLDPQSRHLIQMMRVVKVGPLLWAPRDPKNKVKANGQSNLTTGRIAVAHGRFCGI